MRDQIFITRDDFERLERLVTARRAAATAGELEYLDRLEQELDRAEILEGRPVPQGVVTMNARVRLRDLDTGDVGMYRLVYPSQARERNDVSILAPIGTAILGYRVGDRVEWPVPKGLRRLEIVQVLPEG
jgi:regulator of nucleoside diphosphate kinase